VLPTGHYQNLFSKFDGSGTGTVRLRMGALAQSLLFGESQHPVRIRAYASGVVPLTNTNVQGFSTYGTDGQFSGTAYAPATGAVGASVEYSLTQKLVFALDVAYGFSRSNVVIGRESNGLLANTRADRRRTFRSRRRSNTASTTISALSLASPSPSKAKTRRMSCSRRSPSTSSSIPTSQRSASRTSSPDWCRDRASRLSPVEVGYRYSPNTRAKIVSTLLR
jgi:hypothetical protein